MQRALVALVRHGKYEQPQGVPSAFLPHPLDAEGRAQAAQLPQQLRADAAELGAELQRTVHSSVLLRAYETATIAAEGLGAGYRVVETLALCERCVGSAANLRVEDIESVLARDPRFEAPPPGWKSSPDYCLPLPGAESIMQAGGRVADYIRGQLNQHQPSDPEIRPLFVFVGHGAAMRHAAVHFGIFDRAGAAACSMYHAKPVYLEAQQTEDGWRWRHIHGDWKPRSKAKREID